MWCSFDIVMLRCVGFSFDLLFYCERIELQFAAMPQDTKHVAPINKQRDECRNCSGKPGFKHYCQHCHRSRIKTVLSLIIIVLCKLNQGGSVHGV